MCRSSSAVIATKLSISAYRIALPDGRVRLAAVFRSLRRKAIFLEFDHSAGNRSLFQQSVSSPEIDLFP
jgi:hypothetical protein